MTSHIFPRQGCAELPTVKSGDGVYLIDTDGRRYLDGSSGAAVSCLGHSSAAVADAVRRQLERIAYAHTSFFTSEPAERLAAMLTSAAPDNISRACFVSGGSEAVEAAIKLARQYHVARGEPQRVHIIGRRQSYHGSTLGALAAGGNLWRREMFAPLLSPCAHHIAPCHYWRWGEDGEDAAAYGRRVADELEEKILQLGENTVAAFIAEPVVGATLGAAPAVAGYFTRIRDICRRRGALLILDEVMCGMGRTGSLFACEQEGVSADIICVAKGLGAGIQPLGAMLCDEKLYTAVTDAHGGFQHGHTCLGHAAACAAGCAVLTQLMQPEMLANVRARGAQLMQALRQRFGGHAHIGDIRGRGLFCGIEFVEEGKTPFSPDKRLHRQLKQAALAEGLIVYAMGGTVDGRHGDHLLIAPPFIISEEQINELAAKLARALAAVF